VTAVPTEEVGYPLSARVLSVASVEKAAIACDGRTRTVGLRSSLKKSSRDASCSAVTRDRFFFSIAGASWGEDGPADDVDARLRELAEERMERRGPCCGTAWGLAAAAA
jgi:hypothetical protein